ncbi:hypothetical protein EW145_g3170 [Phellinidium pouzarii]|uniref:Uncharacterized protein n=1 Tax=Phellinidium pouzarii TaxID=167371 RepID=A0A4S4L825_9AGAM|nr:hypothetical protein EW145_g3170 [Phellinidium pouzarii]
MPLATTADSPTLSYYRTIFARAYALNPGLLSDEALFQALLLVLVAKQKHLVVRTAEEEVSRVLKQAVNILHTVFGLSVVKLKLRPSDKLSPDSFLRLMFLESPTSECNTLRISSRKALNGAGSLAFVFKRSSSYPTSIGANIAGVDELYNRPQSDVLETGMHSVKHRAMNRGRHSLRTQADPIPSFLHDEEQGHGMERNSLPQVLAVSGLEYTSEQVQTALWTAMSDRQISLHLNHPQSDQRYQMSTGVWALPDDFFVVYVCSTGSSHERPPVHKSLVDRFAATVEVYLPAENVLDSRTLPPSPNLNAEPPNSILSPSELADLRLLASPMHTLISWRLDLYLSDLFSAARHHPHLDGTLLTARCRADTVHLLRVWRVLFGHAPDGQDHAHLSLDVTDEDVRKVFVRSVQHRLRVLDGPRQEILASLIFTASGNSVEDAEWKIRRRPVKVILREIVEIV